MVISPQTLTDAVLSEIFMIVAGYSRENPDGTVSPFLQQEDSSSRQAPWNCAAVCRHWRGVCLVTPRLWTYITTTPHHCSRIVRVRSTLDSEDDSSDDSDKLVLGPCTAGLQLYRTFLQLSRSGSLPLDIVKGHFQSCNVAVSIMRSIVHHCDRIRSFHVLNLKAAQFTPFLPKQHSFPLLERLTCHVDNTGPSPLEKYDNLPKLRILEYQAKYGLTSNLYLDPERLGIPWHQLHTLTFRISLRRPSPHLFLVFRSLLNLVKLRIGISEPPGFETQVGEDIALPLLQYLEVEDDLPDYFVARLNTPKLHSLYLGQMVQSYTYSAIAQLIRRTDCRITHLSSTCNHPAAMPQVIALLDVVPHLETVSLSSSFNDRGSAPPVSWGDSILKQLAFDDDRPSHYSSLRNLRLHSVFFDPILLVDLVNSRLSASHSDGRAASYRASHIARLEVANQIESAQLVHRYLKTTLERCIGATPGLSLVFDPLKFTCEFDPPF